MSEFTQQQFAPASPVPSAPAGPSASPPVGLPAGPTSQAAAHVHHQPTPTQDCISSVTSPNTPPSNASRTRRRAAPDGSDDEAASGRRTKRLRINRACDQCRGKNGRPGCSGFKPCFTCTRRGVTCTYDAPYTRGVARTPPPPPEGDNGEARNYAQPLNEKGKEHRDKGWIARSCDHCRTHKLPCQGKLPCETCFKERVECTFKYRAHQRFADAALADEHLEDLCHQQLRENAWKRERQLALEALNRQAPDEPSSDQIDPAVAPLQFSVRYAGEEMPPLSFLHRAWRRISIAQALGISNQPAAVDQLVLLSGDMPINPSEPHKFPQTAEVWRLVQDKFAIGWTETFHFLHRLTARLWLDTVYRNWVEEVPLESGIGHAKAAVALMTMALGTMFNYSRWRPGNRELSQKWLWTVNNGDNLFLITFNLTGSEPGPPKLESVQARLLQTLYLLCTCRLSQACYVFSNAIQMLTCLGLHRRRGRNRGLGPEIVVHPEYAKIQCERRTFWSAYIIDKHIATITGQPPHLSIDMTDQALPDCVNDEDMGRTGPFRPHKNDCYMEALLEQAKLAKIVERIMRQVYTLDDVPETERLESALRLGKAVDEWRAQLPSLMTAVKPSLLHLTWRRQQNLVQLAHCHAQMLVYRPFLTAPYPTDGEKKQTTDLAIRTCIEAARVTLTITVNLARYQAERDKSHFHTLLHPHHLTYMAASILYLIPHVRDRQKSLGGGTHHNYRAETDVKLTELANKAVNALFQGTNQYSPARRWAVILEELQQEAVRQVPSDMAPCNERTNETGGGDLDALDEQLLEDALRAHWEADIAREALGGRTDNRSSPTTPAPAPVSRLWDKWKATDWLDFDAAAFGPISDFEKGDLPIAPEP